MEFSHLIPPIIIYCSPLRHIEFFMTNNLKNFIRSLSITNFLGFRETTQTINFGIPNNRAGSGLTLITGQSSTGKSTFIKALIGMKTTPMAIETYPNDQTSITVEYGDKIYIYTKGKKRFPSGQWLEKNSNNDLSSEEYSKECPFIIMNCRNYKHAYFHRDLSDIESTEYNNDLIDVLGAGSYTYLPLFNYILNNEEYKNQFYELIQNIMPELNGELKIERNGLIDSTSKHDLCYLIYEATSGHKCPGAFLSDGWLSVLIIAAKIILSRIKNCPIIIDEPELHLYPSAQKRLANLLSQEAINRQIVVITHSPYFICWNHLENGAKFFRLNKYKEGCTIHELNYSNLKKIKGYEDPARYHLFDIAAKEIMFADKLLFVEGQVDVGIIYKWAQKEERELKFNIFGYGVNGWCNFHIFLQISKELGIKKVAVLYDKAKENDKDPERNNIHLDDDLRQNKELYKDYFFCQLETEDIIDKNKKNGTFNIMGDLKDEYADHFEKIISKLQNYCSDQ